MSRPWSVHKIHQMFADPTQAQAGLPDGRYVVAVASPYVGNLFERIEAAWWVLTSRAHAVIWPEAGDLEAALKWQKRSAAISRAETAAMEEKKK